MADGLALYSRLVATAVRAQLQYRANFVLDVLGSLLTAAIDLVAILVIFHNVAALDGWTVQEITLLYGVSTLAFALVDMSVAQVSYLPRYIRDGSFDVLLVRPRSTLLQVVGTDFSLRKLGKAIPGAAALAYALTAVDVDWTAGRVAMVPLMVVCGAVIFSAAIVATISTVFWVVDTAEISSTFLYGGQYLTQYPITVYDRWLRTFLAYVVPMAFVCYFPSLYVLDKDDPLGLPGWLPFATPFAAAGAAVVAGLVWRAAVRHYRSAGG